MKSKIYSIILATVLFVVGCNEEKKTVVPQTFSNVSVRTSCSPDAKFPINSKYAFVEFASDNIQDSEIDKIDKRIQTALDNELKKKGYKPGEYGDINFFVDYNLLIQQKIDVLIAKSKAEGNQWISAVLVPNDYVSGALLVQIIDAKSIEPIWLGLFNADMAIKSVSEHEKQQRVRYAVHELLKTFPPK